MRSEQGGDRLPPKCVRMDDNGNLPTCTQYSDGTWEVDYPSATPAAWAAALPRCSCSR